MNHAEQVLAHHGVKGMKWGVRRDNGHEGESAKTKKIGKLDKKFEKQSPAKAYISIHNRAAELTNTHDIERINNKPQYKNADFSKDSPLRRQYYNEHQQAFISNVRKAAAELGTNASGTRKIDIVTDKSGNWEPVLTDVKHAGTDPLDALIGTTIKVNYDATGHIVSIEMPSAAQHGEAFVEDFLEHYGVKGMKWGVRREHDGGSLKTRAATAVKDTKAKVKKDIAERQSTELTVRAKTGRHVQVVGGNKRLPHEDAIAARSAEQIAKKNTLDALSNKQLQDLVTRMNLEAQYRNLAVKETRKTAGEKMAQQLLEQHGEAAAGMLGPAAPIGRSVLKTALKKTGTSKAMSGGIVKEDKKKN